MSLKILLFDIETAPILLYAWALHEEIHDPKFIRRDWFVLCWSAKWLDKKRIYHSSLPEFRGYKPLPNKTQKNIDKQVVQNLWNLLDKCDIAIAHNLKGFDRKKANTRFLIHGLPPPSHYQMIDTLSIAKSEFKFTSNRLGYIAKKLNVTQKLDSGGIDRWLGCEHGIKKDWDKMIEYCDTDVLSLSDVYIKERPYINKHPILRTFQNKNTCPKKGCKGKGTVKDGIRRSKSGLYQKLRCMGCGDPLLQDI